MEIYDLRVIERTKRDGFRAATAGYLIKVLSQALNVDVDGVSSNERLDGLADRMGVTVHVLKGELRKINEAMRDRVTPGEIYDFSELRKHKGRIDLQSLLCNGLYHNADITRYEIYLSYIMPANSDRIIYSTDIPITEHNGSLTINAQHGGRQLIHYASTVSDIMTMFKYTKFRLHSNDKVLVIDGVGVESNANGMMTLAINVDTTQHAKFEEVLRLLMTADYVTYSYDKVAPFIIERTGLDQGTIVMHVFPQDDGSALTRWMNHCEKSLKRMLVSILTTLKDRSEAYSAKGLGGQFPLDFYGVLRGTLDNLDPTKSPNSSTSYHISDRVIIGELFQAYINGVTTGRMSDRMAIAFQCLKARNTSDTLIHLKGFIISYISFATLFQLYDNIMTFNKDVNGVKDAIKQQSVSKQITRFGLDGKRVLDDARSTATTIVNSLPSYSDQKMRDTIERATDIISSVQKYLK
uniref:Uncharacterized protein n=1 Tax=viral metagenome TaxID=1070528 RepID=A0A2V0RAB7_9ZZZZ